jgi:predicted HicB family RNase H-like nuclease
MKPYKGYTAKVEFDADAGLLHGEVLGIRDVVTFQGKSVREIEKAFRESVDDYLAFCSERGEEPDRAYSGKFVVRLEPDLHRRLNMQAQAEGQSLNAWVMTQLAEAVNEKPEKEPGRRRVAPAKKNRTARKSG